MSIFITCPVESVDRATAFYTALGWTLNAEMSDHNVSCFAIAPEQYVMLGSREICLLYTSPSPRDLSTSRMPSSA